MGGKGRKLSVSKVPVCHPLKFRPSSSVSEFTKGLQKTKKQEEAIPSGTVLQLSPETEGIVCRNIGIAQDTMLLPTADLANLLDSPGIMQDQKMACKGSRR
jgi:hypothetical protein